MVSSGTDPTSACPANPPPCPDSGTLAVPLGCWMDLCRSACLLCRTVDVCGSPSVCRHCRSLGIGRWVDLSCRSVDVGRWVCRRCRRMGDSRLGFAFLHYRSVAARTLMVQTTFRRLTRTRIGCGKTAGTGVGGNLLFRCRRKDVCRVADTCFRRTSLQEWETACCRRATLLPFQAA